MNHGRYTLALAILSGIFLAVALVACQGEAATPQTRTPARSPTSTAAPTSAVTPAVTIAATPLQSTRILSKATQESLAEDLLEIHGVEPYLVGNLLFIAHWDEYAQRWLVYDVAGSFTPDQLTPPPGATIPPDPEIGMLNELERGKLYDFHVRWDQIVNIVEGETGDWLFNAGANYIKWVR